MVGVALAYTMWFGKWMKSTNLNKILINKSKAPSLSVLVSK
jgi:hypothetical protein